MPQKPKYTLKQIDLGNESIGERLVRFRKAKGLTQTELGKKIGINQMLVSDYERGKYRMSAELLAHFAYALKVSADDLLGLNKKDFLPSKATGKIIKCLDRIESLPPKRKKDIVNSVELLIKGVLS